MNNIAIEKDGVTYTFSVKIERDDNCEPPWKNSDIHGPVTGWVTRKKKPGELVLNSNRPFRRHYDFQEACKIARRDGWDAKPHNDGSETRKQQAAKAARADFEYLRGWCSDEWHYVGVIVFLLDNDGNESDISSSLWGIESNADDYIKEIARELAEEIVEGDGVTWRRYTKETYEWIKDERITNEQ